MNRLYFKVLAWLLVTVAITGAGFLWVTSRDRSGEPGPPHRRLMAAELDQLRRLYEAGNHMQMRAEIDDFRDAGLAVLFTDAAGRDLVGSGDYAAIIGRLERRLVSRRPVLHQGRLYWAVNSDDGKYWLLLEAQSPRRGWIWTAVRGNAWVLGSLALLSLWLAYHITNPIRRLGRIVDAFGHGDLHARVRSTRRDEIGQLSRTFDRMANRIEQLVTSQRRLLTDLSHELRTPLTRLGLAVELARSASGDPAALDRIQKEADRLNDLVGGLLQVTRGEADPAAIEMSEVRLDQLLAQIVEASQLEADTVRIAISGSAPAPVRANTELLRRAIENVLRNAIRYSPPGQVVDVVLEAGSIAIRDRGPGVPQEALPHLFDAFFRVNAGTHEGAPRGFGLGLSIARRAVELHGGAITATNANPGLRVQIRIPEPG